MPISYLVTGGYGSFDTGEGGSGGGGEVTSFSDEALDQLLARIAETPISVVIPPAVAIASITPSLITCVRGDTLRVSLPPMGDLTSHTKILLTAKSNLSDTDTQAILQIVEGIGLTRLNGAIPSEADSASLEVTDILTGTVNLLVNAEITAALSVQDLEWDVQATLSAGIITPIRGQLSIVADVTRSVT